MTNPAFTLTNTSPIDTSVLQGKIIYDPSFRPRYGKYFKVLGTESVQSIQVFSSFQIYDDIIVGACSKTGIEHAHDHIHYPLYRIKEAEIFDSVHPLGTKPQQKADPKVTALKQRAAYLTRNIASTEKTLAEVKAELAKVLEQLGA